jgi:hypothetical protein
MSNASRSPVGTQRARAESGAVATSTLARAAFVANDAMLDAISTVDFLPWLCTGDGVLRACSRLSEQ